MSLGVFPNADPFSQMILLGAYLVFAFLYIFPARVIQVRHGYNAWILLVGFIPAIGAIALFWAFATSEPKLNSEVSA
ncbi:hypothetical protein [Litoreibacter janthinus]|uniref:Uncharacterized protein n=1 Tax=Litoreibacter janthinus TaxID=670154 RepID=A0A1I6HJJ3_9RHOB|nr:hypothetical protein [Litoreibacter janthinus]SFR54477.1 hypothetical protein SAMN04488002_3070 [Litoreibacter janthinus]